MRKMRKNDVTKVAILCHSYVSAFSLARALVILVVLRKTLEQLPLRVDQVTVDDSTSAGRNGTILGSGAGHRFVLCRLARGEYVSHGATAI